jgi:hypothetical protein
MVFNALGKSVEWSSLGVSASSLAQAKNAQYRAHWTLGSLRDLQAFFWLRVFSALKQSPRPPQRHASRTQTVETVEKVQLKTRKCELISRKHPFQAYWWDGIFIIERFFMSKLEFFPHSRLFRQSR